MMFLFVKYMEIEGSSGNHFAYHGSIKMDPYLIKVLHLCHASTSSTSVSKQSGL
jgi:hypothetical protein